MTKLLAGILLLVGVLVVERGMHRPQRSPEQAKAWADWFSSHRDGGGV